MLGSFDVKLRGQASLSMELGGGASIATDEALDIDLTRL